MENYVGIDLGTTNSAICTFDKETQQARVWKSPEQNDVTPSAIYIDRRGNEFVGQTAYNAASRSPDNCATLFRRFMGTTTPIEFSAVNHTLTPEDCSAKVLKTLFGYLPEKIRNTSVAGTVITVPAAFNQMQKNATMAAAEMAGIGKVELVQEPVAAVMSYMKARGVTDGIFLIFDLSDGTLDIAIAESIRKRVNILAHGGIQMCGGRDFDRTLVDNIVRPWLHENFNLPDDLSTDPTFKPLLCLSTWATERAKIELYAKDEVMISLSEVELRINDLNGDQVYLEIPLNRNTYNELIADQINETIDAARETLLKTGYSPNDIECIVWVGRDTHYKPLRDKVAFELGIRGSVLPVNPMTAVAEGASIFAESIDWGLGNLSINEIKERGRRREIVFKTHSGMDLLHNPFYLLKVNLRDSKQAIIDLAEEQSLFSDPDNCRLLQDSLIFPRRRISVEMAWLLGVSIDRADDILVLLESCAGNNVGINESISANTPESLAATLCRLHLSESSSLADEVLELLITHPEHTSKTNNLLAVSKFLGIDKLSPIARINLIAARMLRLPDYTSDIVVKWILAIAQAFEKINPSDVRNLLNAERRESEFPEITDLSDIISEINKLRQYYKQVVRFVLENISDAKERAQVVMIGIESISDNESSDLPILIEDTIDVYEDGVDSLLELQEKEIIKYDQKLRIAAEEEKPDKSITIIVEELIQAVKDWSIIMQPIQLNKKRKGLRHAASHDLSERVRHLAIFLYNEYDKLEASVQILKVSIKLFTLFPEIAERLTIDLGTLNKIAQQPVNNQQISLLDV